ncbi:MAG: hypothetical protein MHPSP_000523 [Paramarteilia canceri]
MLAPSGYRTAIQANKKDFNLNDIDNKSTSDTASFDLSPDWFSCYINKSSEIDSSSPTESSPLSCSSSYSKSSFKCDQSNSIDPTNKLNENRSYENQSGKSLKFESSLMNSLPQYNEIYDCERSDETHVSLI